MSLFGKKSNRSKPSQVWVIDELKFIGKLSAEQQMEFLKDQAMAKLDAKQVRVELEALEHSFNRQSTELEKLRAAAGDGEQRELLREALDKIERLQKDIEEKNLRLGMFDDVMFMVKSASNYGMPRQISRDDIETNHLKNNIFKFLNKE